MEDSAMVRRGDDDYEWWESYPGQFPVGAIGLGRDKREDGQDEPPRKRQPGFASPDLPKPKPGRRRHGQHGRHARPGDGGEWK